MTAIPTAGYPSQKDAILALHKKRMEARRIADQLGVSLNNVTRTVFNYRQKTGRRIQPIRKPKQVEAAPPYALVWELAEDKRRAAFARRAAEGARAALMNGADQ